MEITTLVGGSHCEFLSQDFHHAYRRGKAKLGEQVIIISPKKKNPLGQVQQRGGVGAGEAPLSSSMAGRRRRRKQRQTDWNQPGRRSDKKAQRPTQNARPSSVWRNCQNAMTRAAKTQARQKLTAKSESDGQAGQPGSRLLSLPGTTGKGPRPSRLRRRRLLLLLLLLGGGWWAVGSLLFTLLAVGEEEERRGKRDPSRGTKILLCHSP